MYKAVILGAIKLAYFISLGPMVGCMCVEFLTLWSYITALFRAGKFKMMGNCSYIKIWLLCFFCCPCGFIVLCPTLCFRAYENECFHYCYSNFMAWLPDSNSTDPVELTTVGSKTVLPANFFFFPIALLLSSFWTSKGNVMVATVRETQPIWVSCRADGLQT
jgi:hypothetical protein